MAADKPEFTGKAARITGEDFHLAAKPLGLEDSHDPIATSAAVNG